MLYPYKDGDLIYSPLGTEHQFPFSSEPLIKPDNYILMKGLKPETGLWISREDGTWKEIIDSAIFLTNGQARQQRIQREQQEKIKAEALALKKQVETLNTMVMNEV